MKTKANLTLPGILLLSFAVNASSFAQNAALIHQGRRDVGSRHLAEITAKLPSTGPLPAADELKLAIGLPLRNQAGLKELIQNLYDPASPRFRRYLAADEFAAQFGPSVDDYQAVIHFARTNHLVIEKTYSNRVLLDVRGTVSDIEQAFGVHLLKFRHPVDARDFYAPDTEPTVEANVPILAVKGLDTYELPHPLHKPARLGNPIMGGSGQYGTYMGNDFRNAYLPGVTNTGSGQTVALFELDGYYTNDIIAYETTNGMPQVPLTNVLLDSFDGNPVNADFVVEVSLDIEMAISMAPGLAGVMVYEAPLSQQGAYDILNQMAIDNQAKQISSSWAIEQIVTTSLIEQFYEQFAAQGQSFFQASGDHDSYGPGNTEFEDNPYITTVGGTTLTTTGPGGSYLSEQVWQYGYQSSPNADVGSGGGISSSYPIPTYQLGVNMANNQGSTTMRNVPDVALTADMVYVRANNTNNFEAGTSCAAPLWAGFMALVNQQAAATGHPAVGFINPAIYALGQSIYYTNCFHDITSGNNTNSINTNSFYAVAGFDLCTGWGTPARASLINALVSPAVPPQFVFQTNQGTIMITRYGGAGGAVSIPATLGGLPVTSIGDFAFYDWANVTSVTIPGSVTNIGVGAFADCPNLTSATVSNSFVSMNDDAFAGCSNLTSVCFIGNAPNTQNATVFADDANVTVCYLPGTSGWSSTFDGRPAVELLVTSLNDSGTGSLRQMAAVSPPWFPVTFAANLSGHTIALTSGEINVSQNLTIDASGLPGGIQLNGSHNSAILSVGGGATVTLTALTFTNGYLPGGSGGAIVNNGALTLNRCTLAGNSAQYAGAIVNYGSCFLANCTLAGNSAQYNGGAIDNVYGNLALTQCTLAGNSAGGFGGGIDNYFGQLNIANIIIANNGNDIFNYPSSYTFINGNNIVSSLSLGAGTLFGSGTLLPVDPMLGPLTNNGGPTPTMLPLFGSPAIDAADPNSVGGLTTDQRGLPRVVGAAADIGAVEFQDASPLVTTTADSGQGSLRYASTYSPVGSTITFAPNLSGQTITLTHGEIDLYQNHTIDASALPQGIGLNGNGSNRIFGILGPTVTLNALTLTNGSAPGSSGGAIVNSGALTLNGCTLAGNSAQYAGAIVNYGGCSLVNCTLAGNSAPNNGGAIDNVYGTLTLTQCTLAGNSAGGAGGGIDNYLGYVTAINCIIANNGQDIYNWPGLSFLYLFGANIVEQPVLLGVVIVGGPLYANDPMLGPLANNGGPTPTMLPQPGSPAINNGITAYAAGLNYDQRGPGFPRVTGAAVDIGAVEVQTIIANTPALLTGAGLTNGGFGFSFTNTPGASFTVFATTNPALPGNTWSNLGPAVESPAGSGHYQFTDPNATNAIQRFYRVRSP